MTINVRFEGDIDAFLEGNRVLEGDKIEDLKMSFTNRYTTMIPLRRE